MHTLFLKLAAASVALGVAMAPAARAQTVHVQWGYGQGGYQEGYGRYQQPAPPLYWGHHRHHWRPAPPVYYQGGYGGYGGYAPPPPRPYYGYGGWR